MLRKVYEDAAARAEQKYGPDDARTAEAARDLAFFLKQSGDTAAANAAFAKALRIDEARLGANARQTLAGMIALASVSPPRDAEALLRKALASPAMTSSLAVPALSTIGDLRMAAGDKPSAAGNWRLALKHAEVAYGKESEPVGKLLNSLAEAVPPAEAVDYLRRALDLARHQWGPQHPETDTCEVNLARGLLRAGKPEDAVAHARIGLAGFEATLGPQHPRVAVALSTLAEALFALDRQSREAPDLYRRALTIDRQTLGPADPRTLAAAQALATVLRAQGLPPPSAKE